MKLKYEISNLFMSLMWRWLVVPPVQHILHEPTPCKMKPAPTFPPLLIPHESWYIRVYLENKNKKTCPTDKSKIPSKHYLISLSHLWRKHPWTYFTLINSCWSSDSIWRHMAAPVSLGSGVQQNDTTQLQRKPGPALLVHSAITENRARDPDVNITTHTKNGNN